MPSAHPFRAESQDAPAGSAFAITPGENPLPHVTRALYVGEGGTLAVEMARGGTASFANVPDGALLPLRVTRVLPETTAAAIVGLR